MAKKDHLAPESLMMSYGYNPYWSEGAVKCPIYQTSTFAFHNAEEGKAFFELAYGKREDKTGKGPGLIYSRLNNPDMQILEERLTLWDKAEACAAFESGMSAISTTILALLQPGDLLLHSNPVYGGTHHFFHHVLGKWGIRVLSFHVGQTEDEIEDLLLDSGMADKLKMIYIETPANPTNDLIDIAMCARLANRFSTEDSRVLVSVDNTYMGPIFQHPLKHGADLVCYSATKYIGGHSDVIAGAVLGSKALINEIKTLRTFLGNMIAPFTGWLLLRSLETLKLRMVQQAKNARRIAEFLAGHPLVDKVFYPGFFSETNHPEQYDIYQRQCEGSGAMLSFDIAGGEKEAFTFLNHLQLVKLAVSLGGTESLAEHPYTMTHADVPDAEKESLGLTEKMVRISVGVENYKDLIWDIGQALDAVAALHEITMENAG
ncbi:MAG TPA: cystathionine gamma-synthase family protein [Phnomibacter sp.]|nr:cystathionine gamma-synthase family protein [Phnomibacter sp.]